MINAEIKLDPGDLIICKPNVNYNNCVIYYLLKKDIRNAEWKCLRMYHSSRYIRQLMFMYEQDFYSNKDYYIQKRKLNVI